MRSSAVLTRLLFFFLIAVSPWTAQAWEIESFDIAVRINPDGSALISENIKADFGSELKHGIYRDVPVDYRDRSGQTFKMRLSVLGVQDYTGVDWPYRLEQYGRYLRIKIGDPEKTLSGKHLYRILYRVDRGAVRFFEDHDEFYWNLTGNEWAVPIRNASALVELPKTVEHLRGVAYIGRYGSTSIVEHLEINGNIIRLRADHELEAYEGITLAAGWDKGGIQQPTARRRFFWFITDNWVYFFPLIAFIFMLWRWHHSGRDPETGVSVPVEYKAPDQLRPAEAGVLEDESADMPDITSSVIDLAVRGYLAIEPSEKKVFGLRVQQEYTLLSLKDWHHDPDVKDYEKLILDGIFGVPKAHVKLSDLNCKFYRFLPEIKEKLYEGMIRSGYFLKNPARVRMHYRICGIVSWFIISIFHYGWTGIMSTPVMLPGIIAGLLTGMIIFSVGNFMPRRTYKGAMAKQKLTGFTEFIRRADQDKIRRMNDPGLFERCLPFALAFGLADHWARIFEGIYTVPPSWYAGHYTSFSTTDLTRDMSGAMASMRQNFSSAPSSSSTYGGSGFSGGSSGGGSGGGGGGSW